GGPSVGGGKVCTGLPRARQQGYVSGRRGRTPGRAPVTTRPVPTARTALLDPDLHHPGQRVAVAHRRETLRARAHRLDLFRVVEIDDEHILGELPLQLVVQLDEGLLVRSAPRLPVQLHVLRVVIRPPGRARLAVV